MTKPTARYVIGSEFDDSGHRAAKKAFADIGKQAAEMGAQLAKVGAAAIAAGAAITAGLVKSGLDAIDSQAKLARAMGGTIDSLRAMQLVAADAGVSSDELGSALRKLNQRIGEAQSGSGKAKESLDLLGLSANELSALDTDARMAAIADRVQALGLSSSQTANLLQDFGIKNENMIAVMRQGGDAIREAAVEVRDYGLSLSAVDAGMIEMANDAMERSGRVLESIRNSVTVALAPFLKEIADRFNEVAKANGGFGDQARSVAENLIAAFGTVADVLHVVHMGFKALEIVASGVSVAFWGVVKSLTNIVGAISEGFYGAINAVTGAVNALAGTTIPKIDIDYTSLQNLVGVSDTARARMSDLIGEFQTLSASEWPSEGVDRFLQDVRDRATEASEAMNAAMPGGGEDPESAEADQKIMEDEIAALQARYAMEQQMKADNDAFMEELEKKHMDALADIRLRGLTQVEQFNAMSFKNQVKNVAGSLADMTASVARENKAMFDINKIAGIASAIVSAYEGISKTLAAYPYPLNIGMAAAHAVSAFAQVNAIRSQSFSGGGGTAPSLAGGTPAPAVTPVQGGTPQGGSVLTVEGINPDSLFSGRTVRALAERLEEHMRDGGRLQFA